MIYLTYNDQHTSVFTGQVSDVCNFINSMPDSRITLIAFISIRNYFRNRKKIKQEVSRSVVVPMLPRAKYWKINELTLLLIAITGGHRNAIARNAIATNMCLDLKNYGVLRKVCLDGRGAMAAEWNEYEVMNDRSSVSRIHAWEKRAVTESDYRISVSSALTDHWKERFGYSANEFTVIPCTLSDSFASNEFNKKTYDLNRKKLGYEHNDIVLVYSGSVSGWQSFGKLSELLIDKLKRQPELKLLFLSPPDPEIEKLRSKFPSQVQNKWIPHDQVFGTLAGCDYGILYREDSVTNNVAAPTKFAEYLAAGLQVLISSAIFDYSEFVRDHECGVIMGETGSDHLEKPGIEERLRSSSLAHDHFLKSNYSENYRAVIEALH